MGVIVETMAHSISLAWTASTDSGEAGFSGYNVLRGTVSGGPYVAVNSGPISGTSFTDVGPFNSLGPFFYVAESVAGSAVSGYSNEISVSLPPAAPTALVLVSAV